MTKVKTKEKNVNIRRNTDCRPMYVALDTVMADRMPSMS